MHATFAIFETAIGPGGVAWREQGIIGIQLPEPDAASIRARLTRRFPDAHEVTSEDDFPADIAEAIRSMQALLDGKPADLSAIRLDMRRVPEFEQRVYAIARGVAPGQTLTYGQIASQLGDRLLARDVGQALARNPFPIVVPCHRVLAAGGKLGGFSAAGGVGAKQRLLEIEGADVSWQLRLDA